jgi:hypothetical protein
MLKKALLLLVLALPFGAMANSSTSLFPPDPCAPQCK